MDPCMDATTEAHYMGLHSLCTRTSIRSLSIVFNSASGANDKPSGRMVNRIQEDAGQQGSHRDGSPVETPITHGRPGMLVRIVRRGGKIANVAKSKEGVPLPLCMDPAMVWGERSNNQAFVDAVYPFLAVFVLGWRERGCDAAAWHGC